jgi:hypothetical protein
LSNKKYLAVTIPVDCEADRNYSFDVSSRSNSVEFDKFKNIERNIKREILDYSSTEESPAAVKDDSESISSEGCETTPTDLSSSYRDLIEDEAIDKFPDGKEKTLGHKLMDSKRLRVFMKITKHKKGE